MFGVIQGEGYGNPEQVVLFENETAAEAYALSEMVMNMVSVFGLARGHINVLPTKQAIAEVRADIHRMRNAVLSANAEVVAREYQAALALSEYYGCSTMHVIDAVGPSPTIMVHAQLDLNNLTI